MDTSAEPSRRGTRTRRKPKNTVQVEQEKAAAAAEAAAARRATEKKAAHGEAAAEVLGALTVGTRAHHVDLTPPLKADKKTRYKSHAAAHLDKLRAKKTAREAANEAVRVKLLGKEADGTITPAERTTLDQLDAARDADMYARAVFRDAEAQRHRKNKADKAERARVWAGMTAQAWAALSPADRRKRITRYAAHRKKHTTVKRRGKKTAAEAASIRRAAVAAAAKEKRQKEIAAKRSRRVTETDMAELMSGMKHIGQGGQTRHRRRTRHRRKTRHRRGTRHRRRTRRHY